LPPYQAIIRRIDAFGLPLDACTDLQAAASAFRKKLAAGEPFLVTFMNPSCVALNRKTPRFAEAVTRFDMVLPDGIGLSKAAEAIHGMPVERISFDSTSLALEVFGEAQRRGSRVLLVGGVPGVAERAAARIRESYPDLRIIGALDGYGPRAEKVAQIQALAPDIVVCGMGAVAQEEMLLALAEAGWRGCGFTCGGYLDQFRTRYETSASRRMSAVSRAACLDTRQLERLFRTKSLAAGSTTIRAGWTG
jgi:exopolysaccharide biosynthesis WecB/TagA/CpsF family protein